MLMQAFARKISLPEQYAISMALVMLVAGSCFFLAEYTGYQVVALLLLLTVSAVAMLFDIRPVLLAALASALIWNFFFIPPVYTFHIGNTADSLLFLLYFAVAMINASLTHKIRAAERKARDREEKENTIRLYNTLLNSLSHELRTPVATILGAVDALKENKDRLSPANQAALLSEIGTASVRLNGQVEDLLSMSRLESGMLKPKPDWCDLNELIFSVLHQLAAPGRDHRIVFTPDEQLPLFKLDSGLVEQAIRNIVSNALLYTPASSVVQIEASLVAEQCRIIVSDNGPGFPEGTIAQAFDKFYRVPESKAGGSGLGLSIAKGFIEAHKGTIALENNLQGGAAFTILIPAETTFINHLKNE